MTSMRGWRRRLLVASEDYLQVIWSKPSSVANFFQVVIAEVRRELSHGPPPSAVCNAFRSAVRSKNLKMVAELVASKNIKDSLIRECLLYSLPCANVKNTLCIIASTRKYTHLEDIG
ncbi:hypothetical protein AAMO2058_001259500 [Amorphochlora amoebiformis]